MVDDKKDNADLGTMRTQRLVSQGAMPANTPRPEYTPPPMSSKRAGMSVEDYNKGANELIGNKLAMMGDTSQKPVDYGIKGFIGDVAQSVMDEHNRRLLLRKQANTKFSNVIGKAWEGDKFKEEPMPTALETKSTQQQPSPATQSIEQANPPTATATPPATTATPPATTATPKPESLIGKPQQLNIATGGTSQGVYKTITADGKAVYKDSGLAPTKSELNPSKEWQKAFGDNGQLIGGSPMTSQSTEKQPLPPTESQSFNDAIESSSPATRAENSGAQQVAEKQAVATNSPQQEEKTAKSLPVENAQNKTPPINPSSQPANVDSQTQTGSTTQSNAAITQPRGGVSNLGTSSIASSSEQPLIGAPQRQAFNQSPITSNVLPNEERENEVRQMIAKNDQLQQQDMTVGKNRINAKYAHNQNEQLMGFDVNSKQRNQLEQQKLGQADLNERGNNALDGWKTLLNSDDAKKARAIQQQQADQQGESSRAETNDAKKARAIQQQQADQQGEYSRAEIGYKYDALKAALKTPQEVDDAKEQQGNENNSALAAADKLVAAAKKSGNKEDYNQALAHRNALAGE